MGITGFACLCHMKKLDSGFIVCFYGLKLALYYVLLCTEKIKCK